MLITIPKIKILSQLALAMLPNVQNVRLRNSSSVDRYVKSPVAEPQSAEIATPANNKMVIFVF